MANKTATILDRIVEQKRFEIDRLKGRTASIAQLKQARAAQSPRDFEFALRHPKGPVALIAEVKKASPSAGVIRADFDPVQIAKEYEAAGATCLSVLTDEKFFQGSLQYLKAIRQAVNVPLLRKDFIIDERQILEAIEAGADAILLIVSILQDDELRRFQELASEAGLAALVEVHDEAELDRALAAKARIIGVNNRDLKTFKVDLATTERLAQRMREAAHREPLLVAESGIHSATDVLRLKSCGAQAILVGESLMRRNDISEAVHELMDSRLRGNVVNI